MALPLTKHEEGCIPFRRCRVCQIADIVTATQNKEVVKIFSTEPGNSQFEPGSHLSGCSPINPCANCENVATLKKVLSGARFKLLLELMDDSKPAKVHPQQELPLERLKSQLVVRTDELELSVRSANALKNDHLIYVGDLCVRTEARMLKIPNFGRKSLLELKEILCSMRLRFGMEFPPDVFTPTSGSL